jgi:uncharacterized protein (TIGR02246 family)
MPELPGADQRTDDPAAAVEAPLLALGAAFRQRDARLLESVYADDADWTNAFGTTLRGRREIVAYLSGMFADPHFDAGTPGRPQVSVRPVTDDVVVVKTVVDIEGQQRADGTPLGTRHNYSLKVLQRQPGGTWLIVSEMYMDARSDATYLRGSRMTRVLAVLGATLPGLLGFGSPLLAQTPTSAFVLQISPQGGGRCAEPADREAVQGKNLQMQDCNKSPAQLFTYDAANMRLMTGGLCVDAGDGKPGTLVTLASCSGRANQGWKIEQKREFSELVGINGLCLDIRYGSTSAGAPLQVWDCGDAEPNQLWKLARQ